MFQGASNKIEKLYEVTTDLSTVAYIGDDINDLACSMEPVKFAEGLIGCLSDAAEKAKAIVDYIALHNGGDGTVREFIEWIVNRSGYK